MGEADFNTPLRLEYIDGRTWRVIEPFCYVSDRFKKTICVPHGFRTDFASIPRFFWRVLPPTGRYGKAAVIHDYCYRAALVSREMADAIFLEGMTDLGVSPFVRHTMYYAVRVFGRFAYNRV